MKKLYSLMILVLVVAMLPMGVTAQKAPAVEVVGDSSTAAAVPSGYPAAIIPEALLYDNGPLVTHPGGGYSGEDASVLQTNLGLNTYGFGNQFSYGYRMADDFTITDAGGWQVDQVVFYAYQTGTYGYPPVSTINGIYFQIWDGSPDDPGSTVVFGDLVTNRLAGTSWADMYRVVDYDMLNTQRPPMANMANAGVVLPQGTYWLDWMTNGSGASGPWAPPISIVGETTTGNALQYTGAWAPALDTGLGTQQGMPFTVYGSPVTTDPDIEVTPTSLSAEQCQDTVTQQTLTICNVGGEDLTWTLSEEAAKLGTYLPGKAGGAILQGASLAAQGAPKAVPAAPNPEDVLWDQYANWSGGNYAAQDFEAAYDAYDIYAGDDFENADPWLIDTIVTRGGWTGYVSLINASAIHWYLYADNGGQPAGIPGDGTEFWSLTLAPTDGQVGLGVYEPEDVILTLDTPVNLPAGNWWLVYFVSLEFGLYGQYGFSGTADAVWGSTAMQANPGGGFGMGSGWWTNTGGVDYMFRLEGIPNPTPGVPWLSEDPTGGTIPAGDCVDVTVTFDSTGLAVGSYFGDLLIDSNDPDEPQVVVPVTLIVEECGADTMTCGMILGQPAMDPYGRIVVRWWVQAVDQAVEPLAGVQVTADMTWPAGGPVTRTRFTHPNGIARFYWGSRTSGNWTIDVSDMVLDGYTFVDGPNCSAAGVW